MNYDENGFYPDEKPDSSNTEYTITEKILGIAALVMFIGTIIYIIIMAGQEGKGWNAAYAFFALFIGVGLMGVLNDLVSDKTKNGVNSLVPIGIGIAGIIVIRLFQTGDDHSRLYIVKCIAYLFLLFFIFLGAVSTLRQALYQLSSKDNCVEPVTAKCINVTTYTTSRNNTVTSMRYRPRYEYTYDGVTYKRTGGKTSFGRIKGQEYEILVDPSKPSVFLDPEAEQRGTGNLVLSFLLTTPLLWR